MYTITMDLSMSITDDDHKLDRISESTNSDKYKLIKLPMEQPDDGHRNGSHFGYEKYVGAGTL